MRRYPRRFILSVFSFSVALVLFVTFAGFLNIVVSTASSYLDEELREEIAVQSAETAAPFECRQCLEALPGVEYVLGLYETPGYMAFDSPDVTDDPALSAEDAERIRSLFPTGGSVYGVSLLGLDEGAFESVRPYIDGALESDGVYLPAGGSRAVGDSVTMLFGRRLVEFEVAGFFDASIQGEYNAVTILSSIEVARSVDARPLGGAGYTRLEISADEHVADLALSIQALTDDQAGIYVFDRQEIARSERAVTTQISVLLYGLVAVVTVIGVLNIINTISTGMIVRTREFGILRAIGMSVSQMKNMVRIEAAMYGVYAALIGGTVGVILTRLLFINVHRIQDIPWELPWEALAVSAVGAVLAGLAASHVPIKRIAAMDIVAALRRD